MQTRYLCGMTASEIFDLIGKHGFTYDHALKIATGFYRKRVREFAGMADIPKKLRELLASELQAGIFPPVKFETSSDLSVKYLFSNPRGEMYETVFIPDGKRKTVCVSSQSGCRMGCPFCLTGKYGFSGNLDAGDILNQVISLPLSAEITHVVFMGMGEPLDNLHEVLKATEIMKAGWGLAMSPARITVSTVGITPAVKEFLAASDCNLTLSLYSPFPGERSGVVPAERKYPVSEIIGIMKSTGLKRKRRLSLAYIMIKDINDTDRHLEGIIRLLSGTSIRINLLPFHSTGDEMYRSSEESRIQHFRQNLTESGISASIRKSRGADISAACGLLAAGMKS